MSYAISFQAGYIDVGTSMGTNRIHLATLVRLKGTRQHIRLPTYLSGSHIQDKYYPPASLCRFPLAISVYVYNKHHPSETSAPYFFCRFDAGMTPEDYRSNSLSVPGICRDPGRCQSPGASNACIRGSSTWLKPKNTIPVGPAFHARHILPDKNTLMGVEARTSI